MKPKPLIELATSFVNVAEQINMIGPHFPWLNDLRQQALKQFNSQGLPGKKEEDWKYTSLWDLAQQAFSHHVQTNVVNVEQCEQVALLNNAYRFVIIDGVFSRELSLLEHAQEGFSIASLSTCMASVEQYLGQHVDITQAGFTALNTLLMNDGLVITVAADTDIARPIELLVINSGTTENLAIHLRHVIVLGKGSKATLIEHYVGLTEHVAMTNVVSEVALAEGAELNHYKLQQESVNAFHIATLAAKQSKNSQWNTHNISLGARLARHDLHSRLEGKMSHTTMNGLYLVNGHQHVDNHTCIEHLVPDTTSDEIYKGVLDDNSHAVFNGKVLVHEKAQKTHSHQSNHNLLLSRGCEIDTKPEMEIYADDVKCGHGSTVGQISQEQLFFLRARGLDETSARSLLTYAFAVDVLERISSDDIRQALATVIEERLPCGGVRV